MAVFWKAQLQEFLQAAPKRPPAVSEGRNF
jgi:hypothetical protein